VAIALAPLTTNSEKNGVYRKKASHKKTLQLTHLNHSTSANRWTRFIH